MAGTDEVVRALRRVDRDLDRVRAIRRGDAGGDALARLDRNREGGAERRLVLARHLLEAELVAALLGQAEADQPARVRRHEVDRLGRRELRGDRQVALVLAVLGVDDDDEASLADVLDRLLDGRERRARLNRGAHVESLAPSRRSTYFARTSTSRLTSSPGRFPPSVVTVERVRHERDLEALVVECRDRQRDAVDRDRALLDAIAQQLGRRLDRRAARRRTSARSPRRRRGPGRSGRRAGRRRASQARGSPRRRTASTREIVSPTTSNASVPSCLTTVRQTPSTETESPIPGSSVDSTTSLPSSNEATRRAPRRCP